MKREEIYWLIGTTGFSLILILAVFGTDGLKTDTVIDINFYDTYYVLTTTELIILLTILTFFVIYLIRMLREKFKNQAANLIFIISNIILIWTFTFLISFVNKIREIPGITEYPPLTGIENVEHTGNIWNAVYYVLPWVQLILIILLTISGVKIGLNYKRTE